MQNTAVMGNYFEIVNKNLHGW